jgi:hypothetical protein
MSHALAVTTPQIQSETRSVASFHATETDAIQRCFQAGEPFVIHGANANPHGIDTHFLSVNHHGLEVSCFTPEYTSGRLRLGALLSRIRNGEKYRLRADVSLGSLLQSYFDVDFFQRIRSNKRSLMDLLLHVVAGKKWGVFLSTPSCKMSNHAHINSTFVIQLEGEKTWHLGFRALGDIEHRDLYSYDYIAEKRPEEEMSLTMRPGDILYLPAYWFHYTDTDDVSLSMHYMFGEPLSYYFRRAIRPLFLYELFRRPLGMLKLALARDNEVGFGDKARWQKTKTDAELQFLAQNDFS